MVFGVLQKVYVMKKIVFGVIAALTVASIATAVAAHMPPACSCDPKYGCVCE